MSYCYYVYTGPMILVPTVIRERIEDINACPDSTCTRYGRRSSGRFCLNCGKRLGMKQQIKYDATAEIADAVSGLSMAVSSVLRNGVCIFVVTGNDRTYMMDPEHDGSFQPNIDSADELNRFKADYADDIAKIQAAFQDPITVTWGLFTYCS